jgi:chromosome partitioning protein
MRIIAFANQKGGVGKTTSAVNLAACLANLGRRALLIDLDPQANASIHLGLDVHAAGKSIYDVLTSKTAFSEVVRQSGRENLDVAPSHIDLSGVEIELTSQVGRETILRDSLLDFLAGRDPYNYIIIDCPPSLGLLSLNALTTASEVFIPVQAEFFALQGMSKLLEVISLVRRRLNPTLEITGIIATRFDCRKSLAKEVIEDIRKHFGERLFSTLIRDNIRLAEAPGYGKTIIEYDPNCHGAEDYLALAREVIGKEHETETVTTTPPNLSTSEAEGRR